MPFDPTTAEPVTAAVEPQFDAESAQPIAEDPQPRSRGAGGEWGSNQFALNENEFRAATPFGRLKMMLSHPWDKYVASVDQGFKGVDIPRVEAESGTGVEKRAGQVGAAVTNTASGIAGGVVSPGGVVAVTNPATLLYSAPRFIVGGIEHILDTVEGALSGEDNLQETVEKGAGGVLMLAGGRQIAKGAIAKARTPQAEVVVPRTPEQAIEAIRSEAQKVIDPNAKAALEAAAVKISEKAQQGVAFDPQSARAVEPAPTPEITKTPPAKLEAVQNAIKDPDTTIQYNVWDLEMIPPGRSRVAQVDLPSPNAPRGGAGDGNWSSTNLELLRELGVDAPDVPEWLPPGRYTLEQVKQAIADGPPATAEVGLGAASPAEFQPVKEFTTSMRNAEFDREAVARGQPPPIEAAKKTFGATWDEAMAKIDENQNVADELLTEVREAPRPLKDFETAILAHRKIDLENQFNRATRNLEQNIGTPDSLASDRATQQRALDELLELRKANREAGTELGRGLNIRKAQIAEDYSLATMMTERSVAKGGAKLTPDEVADVVAKHKKITDAQKALQEHENAVGMDAPGPPSERVVDQIIKEVSSEQPKAADAVKSELDGAVDSLRIAVKQNPEINDGSYIQKIAEGFVRRGVKEREALIDAVHNAIKDIIPGGITRRQTMDAISGYGDFRKLDPDAIKAELRDLKGQMQQIGKLQDMEAGRAPAKTGGERRIPSNEERRLIKQVEEAKRKGGFDVTDPAKQLKTALASIKTRLQNSIRDLEQQISTKTQIVKGKTSVVLDAEAAALKLIRDKLKAEYDAIFSKPELTDAQRIALAEKSADRQISELQRQLKNEEVFPAGDKPELKSAALDAKRAQIEALKEEREYARQRLQPKEDRTPDDISLQAFKTRTASRIAELQRRISQSDFSKNPKREQVRDDAANILQAKLDAAKAEFDSALESDRYNQLSGIQKLKEQSLGAYDAARNLMTTGEFSFVLRQGKLAGASHPVMAARALPKAFQALFGDEVTARAIDLQTKNDPIAAKAIENGVHFAEDGAKLSAREEMLASKLADKIPILKNFNQAGRVFLNKLRIDLYKTMAGDAQLTPEQGSALAKYVNEATGRGSLGGLEKSAVELGRVLFAPRYLSSRIQYLTGHSMWGGDLATRRIIAKEYARTLVGLGVYYASLTAAFNAMVDDPKKEPVVTLDPRSSDFGKVKMGDTRLDPMAGLSQVIVFGARTGSGEKINAKGAMVPLRGDVPYGGQKWSDVATTFARSKLHPIPGAVINIFDGTDLAGQPATLQNQAFNMVAPLSYFDIYEALEEQDLPEGVSLGLLALLGEGLQTYKNQKPKKQMGQPAKKP